MIRIDFDPARIDGSSLLGANDLKDPVTLAVKLRDAGDPLSHHLQGAFSPEMRQLLAEHDGSKPLPESLRGALVDELNQLLEGPDLFDKKRFKGVTWTRETLMRALVRQEMQGQNLVSRNRLLLEEAYPKEITKSRKAEWEAWTSLACAATGKVIAEWEGWKLERNEWKKKQVGPSPEFKPTWDDDVWRGFRDWLLVNVFKNKCAYCETAIVGFPGDAEHFRPKGQVRVILEDGKSEIVKIVDEDNEELTHPGYFWLAYHWQNILPSCELCNRTPGKQDLFPVGRSHVAVKRLAIGEIDKLLYKMTKSAKAADIFYLEPRDLDAYEGRLLLHPYYDNPEEHLYFKLDGTAAAWNGSKQGEASIAVFALNENGKVEARRGAQRDGLRQFNVKLGATRDQEDELSEWKRAAQELRDEYYCGRRSYAVAVFDYIHHHLEGTDLDPDFLLGERRQTR